MPRRKTGRLKRALGWLLAAIAVVVSVALAALAAGWVALLVTISPLGPLVPGPVLWPGSVLAGALAGLVTGCLWSAALLRDEDPS